MLCHVTSHYIYFGFIAGVQIAVMTLKNTYVRLDVAISDTVGSVLAKVAAKAGISPDEQMLTYHEKPMDDRKTLSDYGFKAHYKYIIRLAKRGITLVTISVLKMIYKARKCNGRLHATNHNIAHYTQ